jgi:hypothetical protein
MAAERKNEAAKSCRCLMTIRLSRRLMRCALARKIVARPDPVAATSAVIDLTGRPNVLLAIGAGTQARPALRWIAGRAVVENRPTLLAAIDPENRELEAYLGSPHGAPGEADAIQRVQVPAGGGAASRPVAVATRNDEQPDAQSRPISGAHYLRLVAGLRRTLSETQRTIVETDARSCSSTHNR